MFRKRPDDLTRFRAFRRRRSPGNRISTCIEHLESRRVLAVVPTLSAALVEENVTAADISDVAIRGAGALTLNAPQTSAGLVTLLPSQASTALNSLLGSGFAATGGGTGNDTAPFAAVDASGNIYVAGLVNTSPKDFN